MVDESALSPTAAAIMNEVKNALQQLEATGRSHTIFIDKMGLSPVDRKAIHDFLGIGDVKIVLKALEPAEWIESSFSGVWHGVFKNIDDKPILETIEIAYYPRLAGAQKADIQNAISNMNF